MYDFFRFFYATFFLNSLIVEIMFFAFLGILIFASVLAYHLSSGSFFFAVSIVLFGFFTLALWQENIRFAQALPLFSLLTIVVGVSYLLVFILIKVKQKRARKRTEREIKAREMCYSLPQKDNTFVRARLGSISQDEEVCNGDVVGDMQLRFAYAKTLLEKLRLKTLCATERLEMDELANVFAVYSKKELYVGEDVRLLNDAFSRVLKLAGKYAV